MFCININVRDDVFKCDLSMIISVTSVIVPSRGIMELIDWNIKNTTSLHTDDNMDNIIKVTTSGSRDKIFQVAIAASVSRDVRISKLQYQHQCLMALYCPCYHQCVMT
jgi:hypothetical protein